MKFVYMVEMPNLDPASFCGGFENDDHSCVIVGLDNKETAKELFCKYTAEGYDLFNLCSGFTPEDAAAFEAMAEGTKVRAAVYEGDQVEKIDALEDFSKYGAIFVAAGLDAPKEVRLSGPDFDMTGVYITDQESANAAARKLVEEGVTFIELCSWFDAEKTQSVIDAIGGAVPVGSCGL